MDSEDEEYNGILTTALDYTKVNRILWETIDYLIHLVVLPVFIKLDAINQRRQTEHMNQFLLNTAHFFNTFSALVENKFQKIETNLQRIDADFAILDSKVNNIWSLLIIICLSVLFSCGQLLDIKHLI